MIVSTANVNVGVRNNGRVLPCVALAVPFDEENTAEFLDVFDQRNETVNAAARCIGNRNAEVQVQRLDVRLQISRESIQWTGSHNGRFLRYLALRMAKYLKTRVYSKKTETTTFLGLVS